MVLEDGPLKSAFERDTKGVVKQEFITDRKPKREKERDDFVQN